MKERNSLLSKLSTMLLAYFGVCLLMLSFLISRYPFWDSDTDYILDLLRILGMIFMLSGVVFEAYRRLSIKIDSISTSTSAFNAIGIERIIPLRDFRIEEIFPKNKRFRIIINVNENHSFQRLLSALRYAEAAKSIKIIIIGEPGPAKQIVFGSLSQVGTNPIEIRTIEKSGIDNIIILDERTYVINLSAIDNKLNFVIDINNYSEHGVKSEELFEDLWNEGDVLPIT